MEIRVGENESLESAIKRWKRKCARSGILADARKREHYEKPSVKRKRRLKLQGNASINCILLYRFFKMNRLCCRSF